MPEPFMRLLMERESSAVYFVYWGNPLPRAVISLTVQSDELFNRSLSCELVLTTSNRSVLSSQLIGVCLPLLFSSIQACETEKRSEYTAMCHCEAPDLDFAVVRISFVPTSHLQRSPLQHATVSLHS
ncbi:hypothetical protein Ciccas_005080 [Cichlidogyrus casuarinus]|uniref:Uncharacterized protein n=1 Tax=Cichlidogyrus casuarinus TaxID=1844966 RepID=A0ABD2QA37_9PLAT